MPRRESVTQDHAQHDRLLVARFAAGDAYASESERARHLLESCPECNALAVDIRLISAQAAQLTTIARPRDFRISAERAEQLRGSPLDRFLRRVSTPSWSVARPLAGAAFAIGLLLAAMGALPGIFPTGAPPSDFAVTSASSVPSPAMDTSGPAGARGSASVYVPPDVLAPASAATTQAEATAEAPVAAVSQATASVGGLPRPMASAAASAQTGEGNVDTSASAVPPKSVATFASVVVTPTQLRAAPTPPSLAYVVPASPPAAAQGTEGQSVNLGAATGADMRTVLLLGGAVVALMALVVLIVLWLARRRYSDPLMR